MKTEKRFYITDTGLGLDTESDEMYSFGDEKDFCRLFDKLNEQDRKNKELKKENEELKKRIYLYEMNEDEVDKYLRTHPMPTTTITNKRKVIPLDMRHKW